MREISEFLRQPTEADLWSILDLLKIGVVLLGPDRQVEGMNARAAAMCREGDAIRVDDSLRARSEVADARLAAAMKGKSLRVIRLPRGANRRPLEALVLPFRDRTALLIADADGALEPGCYLLRSLYGLTPSETRVAIAIADGASVADA